MTSTWVEHLPSYRVYSEAHDYLDAFRAIIAKAGNGSTDLYWPAAMVAGLACELYLKSFLVEADPDHPGCLKRLNGHNLRKLYDAIPSDLRSRLNALSQEIEPAYPLEARIDQCSNLFFDARYSYETGSINVLQSQMFTLAPHLEAVLRKMTATSRPE